MKPIKGFDQVQPLGESQRLPAGGYVLEIKAAYEQNYDWGDVLLLNFEIHEGSYKGFFKQNFEAQKEPKKWKGSCRINWPTGDKSEADEFAARRVKSMTTSFENSNPGYKWNNDENSLVGKLVGGLFRNAEFRNDSGDIIPFTEFAQFRTVDKIRNGEFEIPADRPLKESNSAPPPSNSGLPFTDDDVPY